MELFQRRKPELPFEADAMSFLVPQDEEVERALRFVALRTQRSVPPRIRLAARPEQSDVGPACPACSGSLDRRHDLVACPRCLSAFHPACWPSGERCWCERPRPRGRGHRPR
ncbi:MAG TPA: hypothetical protein DEA08_35850 [Planctomycetes bacterium]|nr:hypothetical protein [Planctomycetota bacterium]